MLTNITYVTQVKKGGDLNYVLKEISNFYDADTKRSFNQMKFLKDFCGILLEKLDIEKTDIFIDEDLMNNNTCCAFHHLGKIYISKYFLKRENRFLDDLIILSHEFSHLNDFVDGINIERKVGKNSNRLKLSFNDLMMVPLKMTDKYSMAYLYETNECEHSANVFAFEYVLSLLQQSQQVINKNSIEYAILNVLKQRVENTYQIQEMIREKYQIEFVPELQLKAKNFQEKWFVEIKENLHKIQTNKKPSETKNCFSKIVELNNQIIQTFFVYENFELLNKMKNYYLKNSNNSIFMPQLYIECLNFHNYVVTNNDIKDLLNLYEKSILSFDLKDVFLQQQNFKEHLIKAKYKKATKNDFKNMELNEIETSKDLLDYAKFYFKSEKINIKNM